MTTSRRPPINNVTVTEGNTGTVKRPFTVTLSAASGQTVTVNYATANGTATAGSDYTATVGHADVRRRRPRRRPSRAGARRPARRSQRDLRRQPDGAGQRDDRRRPGTGTITDNDAHAVAVDQRRHGDRRQHAARVNAAFTVTLSAASGQTVTVNYATANGTARGAGATTPRRRGTLTFAAGIDDADHHVPVVGDTLDEANETFVVNLTAPSTRRSPTPGRRHHHRRRRDADAVDQQRHA